MRTAAAVGISMGFSGCLDDIDSLEQDGVDTEEMEEEMEEQAEEQGVMEKNDSWKEFDKEDIDLSSPKAVVNSFLDLNLARRHEYVTSDETVEMLREMFWERSPAFKELEPEHNPRIEWYDAVHGVGDLSVVEEDLSVDDMEDAFVILGDIEDDILEIAANLDNALVEGEREDDDPLKTITVQPDDEWLLFR